MATIVDLETHPAAYVTVKELAVYFGVSKAAVRKWILCGILPAGQARPNSKRLVTTVEARAFERRQFGPTTASFDDSGDSR